METFTKFKKQLFTQSESVTRMTSSTRSMGAIFVLRTCLLLCLLVGLNVDAWGYSSTQLTVNISGSGQIKVNTSSSQPSSWASSSQTKNQGAHGMFDIYVEDTYYIWVNPSTGYHCTGVTGDVTGAWNSSGYYTVAFTGKTSAVKKTVTANFVANTYTIVFHGNGNTGGSMNNLSMTYDTPKNLTANAYAKTGYHFKGWATSPNGSVAYSDEKNVNNLTTTHEATIDLYAVWEINTYSIAFNANGGTGSISNLAMTYGTAKNLTANTFTRTGYTFNGWNTADNGSGTSYTDAQSVNNLTTTNNATVTLYAKWVANSYTVNFNANGGTVGTASKSVTYDATYGDLPIPTRSGYTFAGWFTEESTGTQIAASTKVAITDAQTLYAHWLANYAVAFNANGGNGSMTDQAFVEGTAQNLTANAFTRTGYTFAGWATSADGNVVYTNEQNVNNLTTTGNEVINLYAKWNVHTYVVVFNGNGNTSGSMSNQAFTYDEDAKALTANAFAKSYTVTFNANGGTCETASLNAVSPFLGWATSANGEKVYDDEQSVRNLTAENNGTVNLYAKWGVGSIVLPTATGETNLDHLEGWFNGDEKVGDAGSAYTPTSDMALTAHWTREQLTPSFGGENTALKVGAEQTSAFSFNNTEGPVAHIDVTAIDAINDGSGKVIEYDANTNTVIARNAGTATIYFTQAETEAVKAATSDTLTYTVTKNDPAFSGSAYNNLKVDDVQTADYTYSNTSALVPSASAEDDFYFTVDDIVFANAEKNKGTNLVTYNPSTKEITANNAGTGTITLHQKETFKYNAGNASFAVAISKYTPSFSGSAYNDLKVDDVQSVDYAYSNTSAAKPSASGEDDFYFTVDDIEFANAAKNNGNALVTYDAVGNSIIANNAGTGKITLRQKETYKYNAVSQSFEVAISKYTPSFSGSNYNS